MVKRVLRVLKESCASSDQRKGILTGHSPHPDGTNRPVNVGVVPGKPGVTQDDRLAGCRQKHELDGLPVAPRQEHMHRVCPRSYPPQHVSIQGSSKNVRRQSLWTESQPQSEGPVHDALVGP